MVIPPPEPSLEMRDRGPSCRVNAADRAVQIFTLNGRITILSHRIHAVLHKGRMNEVLNLALDYVRFLS